MSRHTRLNPRRTTAPRIQTGLVDRPRLTGLARLLERYRLVLVHAPAGAGKTTLLSQWHEALRESGGWTAWYSASETERDQVSLADFLFLAIQGDNADPAIPAIEIAPLADSREAVGRLISRLGSAIEARPPAQRRLILFIDDFHLIDGELEAETINAMLSAFPETVTLVLASRTRPTLPLGRFRVRGELLELTVRELQFSIVETQSFFRSASGLELSMDESSQLHNTTEGWAAGLRLAALLQDSPSSSFLRGAPAGSQRAFAEYFLDEVIAGLPEDVCQFLEYTSILESLTPDLCDALMQKPGSAALLERIERAQLFVTELQGRQRWYKYHHLFQEFLLARLQARGPEIAANLHERASEWFIATNMPIEAVRHAFQARMPERAAELIERYCTYDYLSYGRFETYYRWMSQLPKEWREGRPLLMFLLAWRYINTRQFLQAEQTLSIIEEAARDPAGNVSRIAAETGLDIAGRLDLMRALIAAYGGHLVRARQHIDRLEGRSLDQLAFGLVDFHSIHSYLALNEGNLDLAERLTWRANAVYEEIGCHWGKVHSQCIAAMSYMARGRFNDAAQVLAGTLELARTHFSDRSYMVALTAALSGLLAYNEGDLAKAETLWLGALPQNGRATAAGLTERQDIAIRGLVRIYDLTGRPEEASALLLRCSRRAFEIEDFRLEFHLGIERAARAFRHGNLLEARREYDRMMMQRAEAQSRFSPSAWQIWEPFGLLEARERLAARAPSEAAAILTHLAETARAQGRFPSALRCEAFAAQLGGESANTLTEFRRQAREMGMARLFDDFVDPPPTTATWTGRDDASPRSLGETLDLTAREQEILALMRRGLGNTEIGEELGIKLNTVKSHAKNLFSKLNVRSRTQAVLKTLD